MMPLPATSSMQYSATLLLIGSKLEVAVVENQQWSDKPKCHVHAKPVACRAKDLQDADALAQGYSSSVSIIEPPMIPSQ